MRSSDPPLTLNITPHVNLFSHPTENIQAGAEYTLPPTTPTANIPKKCLVICRCLFLLDLSLTV